MENNPKLYECIYNILILNTNIVFNINNPIIELGYMLGYFISDENNNTTISNQVLKEVIYNYMISKTDTFEMNSYTIDNKEIFEVMV